jgi:hypothetical protein
MKVDQFESVFRSADKPGYNYQRIEFRQVLVVTDLEGGEAEGYLDRMRGFLRVLGEGVEWSQLGGADYREVESLLGAARAREPELVCTYRSLHSKAYRWPYSLGEHLDVLTQTMDCPVLVAPHPAAGRAFAHAMKNTNAVMAMTDHLTGDDRLVNHAVRMTEPEGMLWLTHVEDGATFERYIAAISKIASIDTELAQEEIRNQLLKEPADFIESCRLQLEQNELRLTVEGIVTIGRRLEQYRGLIQAHEVDLLVMNTKDEDQLAMHGLAYPLAVELRGIPLLLL